jgi:hypothetical protein
MLLTLDMDFDHQRIDGEIRLTLESKVDQLFEVILDMRGINIKTVKNKEGTNLSYDIQDPNPKLGQALHIFFDAQLNRGQHKDIIITYQTNAE